MATVAKKSEYKTSIPKNKIDGITLAIAVKKTNQKDNASSERTAIQKLSLQNSPIVTRKKKSSKKNYKITDLPKSVLNYTDILILQNQNPGAKIAKSSLQTKTKIVKEEKHIKQEKYVKKEKHVTTKNISTKRKMELPERESKKICIHYQDARCAFDDKKSYQGLEKLAAHLLQKVTQDQTFTHPNRMKHLKPKKHSLLKKIQDGQEGAAKNKLLLSMEAPQKIVNGTSGNLIKVEDTHHKAIHPISMNIASVGDSPDQLVTVRVSNKEPKTVDSESKKYIDNESEMYPTVKNNNANLTQESTKTKNEAVKLNAKAKKREPKKGAKIAQTKLKVLIPDSTTANAESTDNNVSIMTEVKHNKTNENHTSPVESKITKNTSSPVKPDTKTQNNWNIEQKESKMKTKSERNSSDSLSRNGKEKTLSSTHKIPEKLNYFVGATNIKLNILIDKYNMNYTKYVKLKTQASVAAIARKIFTVHGKPSIVRNALKRRGWVEKLSDEYFSHLVKLMNTSTNNEELAKNLDTIIMSNMLKKHSPDFIWLFRSNPVIFKSLDDNRQHPLINRLIMDNSYFTSKEGLCSSLKNEHWFFIENVADVNIPRSYNVFDKEELEDFKHDYRITACTSLLQWFEKNIKNPSKQIISPEGTVSLWTVFFALKRCQSYIQCQQHKDIDKFMKDAKLSDWIKFLENYGKLINGGESFKEEDTDIVNYYLDCTTSLLLHMSKYRAQLECEGTLNTWIIKPAHWCRGRGIHLANDLKAILNKSTKSANNKFVVQKYIETPLLIYDTKFDIRQYYMVTSTYPLKIWMYKTCYLRFSSQRYSLNRFHEAIHLTNNAVQHKYKNSSSRHPSLPEHNMWDLQEFKIYLEKHDKGHVWDEIIYPGMRKNIVGAMLSCQDGMGTGKNRFELYGCDFILSTNYKPWLIEINSGPDMTATTPVTAKLCPQTLEDIVKVVIDNRNDPNAPTGDFECIYHQTVTNIRSNISSMVLTGSPIINEYFCKAENVYEPQYEDLEYEELNIDLPLKHECEKISEECLLKEAPSIGETMVSQYKSQTSLTPATCIESFKSENKIKTQDSSIIEFKNKGELKIQTKNNESSKKCDEEIRDATRSQNASDDLKNTSIQIVDNNVKLQPHVIKSCMKKVPSLKSSSEITPHGSSHTLCILMNKDNENTCDQHGTENNNKSLHDLCTSSEKNNKLTSEGNNASIDNETMKPFQKADQHFFSLSNINDLSKEELQCEDQSLHKSSSTVIPRSVGGSVAKEEVCNDSSDITRIGNVRSAMELRLIYDTIMAASVHVLEKGEDAVAAVDEPKEQKIVIKKGIARKNMKSVMKKLSSLLKPTK